MLMAERRMFAKTIIDSDAFLDMPLSTQALYFHLSMRADDDGFINNPKKIQRMVGASDDDLKLLIAKNFIIPFESGIVVIKHWKIHNYIRNDRYKETVYKEEMAMLTEKENKAYTLDTAGKQFGIPSDNHVVYQTETQYRLGQDRLGKVSLDQYTGGSSAVPSDNPPEKCPVYLPLIDGSEYGVKQSDVENWTMAYPAVNILTELHKMKAWLDANPKNRKTSRGIKKFIIGWLGRSQDKAPRAGATSPSGGGSFSTDEFFEAAVARAFEEKEPPKTAADDDSIRERAEALKQKVQHQR
jgi:hypothetical protein